MNAAHRLGFSSQYLPAVALTSGLVVTLAARAWAPLTIGRCSRAKTNLDRAAPTLATFAKIFSSFRLDDAFFAIAPPSLQDDPIRRNAASRGFFAASATVSTILGGQSMLATRFGRPNPH
jgi:hypothetical protein